MAVYFFFSFFSYRRHHVSLFAKTKATKHTDNNRQTET